MSVYSNIHLCEYGYKYARAISLNVSFLIWLFVSLDANRSVLIAQTHILSLCKYYEWIYIYIYIYMSFSEHICIYICPFLNIYIYVYQSCFIYIYIYIYIYVFVSVRLFTRTHINIHFNLLQTWPPAYNLWDSIPSSLYCINHGNRFMGNFFTKCL